MRLDVIGRVGVTGADVIAPTAGSPIGLWSPGEVGVAKRKRADLGGLPGEDLRRRRGMRSGVGVGLVAAVADLDRVVFDGEVEGVFGGGLEAAVDAVVDLLAVAAVAD